MRNKRTSLFVMTAILSVSAAVFASSDNEALKQIAGYRDWTPLTDRPYAVSTITAMP